MDEKKLELLKSWRKKLKDAQDAHYHKAANLNLWRYIVGVPVVLFTVFVGSELFATLEDGSGKTMTLVMGVVAVFTAVLASVQTFMKFPERSNLHRVVAVQLGFLKKDMDKLIAVPPPNVDDLDVKIDDLRKKWDDIISEAPTIPNGLWNRIKKRNAKDENEKTK